MEIASDTLNINCDVFEADTRLVGNKLQCVIMTHIDKISDPCISYCAINVQILMSVPHCIHSIDLESISFNRYGEIFIKKKLLSNMLSFYHKILTSVHNGTFLLHEL